jgi:hypothetical protein
VRALRRSDARAGDVESSSEDGRSARHGTAKVQAIDVAKREVTLKGPLGNIETIVVSGSAQRLNEVKVGDDVTVSFTHRRRTSRADRCREGRAVQAD